MQNGLVRLTEANRFRTSDGLTGMIMQGELGEVEWLRGGQALVRFPEAAVTILGGPSREQKLVLPESKFEVVPLAGPKAAPFVDDWVGRRLLCLQCNALWSPSTPGNRGPHVCPADGFKLVDIGTAQEDKILGAGRIVSVDGESYIPDRQFSMGYASDLYMVRSQRYGKCVAKVLHQKYSNDLNRAVPFREESLRSSKFKHENLVRALDFGVAELRPFIIFEWLEGKTVAQILWQHGSMHLYDALFMARDVAETMVFLAARGIHHEDLNPSEIMMLPNSDVKLLDLGKRGPVAALSTSFTSGGAFGGDASYTAPEILNGAESTLASNIYSLGCILFEALAGRNPFRADSVLETSRRQLDTQRPEIASLREGRVCPPKIKQLVKQMIAIEPNQRPTIQEVRDQLTTLSH